MPSEPPLSAADVIGAPIRQGQRWGGGSSGRQPFTRRVHTEPPPTHIATPVEAAQITRRNGVTAGVLLAAAGATYYTAVARDQGAAVKPPSEQHLVNWSGTHECVVEDFYQPESLPELEALVKQAHASGQKLRCVGSALSPNGIAFQKAGMVSLSLMDKILAVDKASGRVTVQAGARVAEVALALRQQGLSLANYASIREQTMGGLTQVSAHGTGARVPPLDDSVVGIKLVTPALGTLDLSAVSHPCHFCVDFARVLGIGTAVMTWDGGCIRVAASLRVATLINVPLVCCRQYVGMHSCFNASQQNNDFCLPAHPSHAIACCCDHFCRRTPSLSCSDSPAWGWAAWAWLQSSLCSACPPTAWPKKPL